MLVVVVLLAVVVARKAEAALVEGDVVAAVHKVEVGQEVVGAAFGAVHTLEEEANSVEADADAVVVPGPNRQKKLTVHPNLDPRKLPVASGVEGVVPKPEAQVVREQQVLLPIVYPRASVVVAAELWVQP
jgi:hypothetical protein